MKKILELHNIVDKSTWPPGPWNNEPDKLHFIDEETNMDCLVVRGPVGALCGYVGVDSTHPAFQVDYNRVMVDVHGGLTYGSMCDEGGHICHVPQNGRPHDVFWLGFDCSHSSDLAPAYDHKYSTSGTYKELEYVIAEVRSLANQLAKREPIRDPYDWEIE